MTLPGAVHERGAELVDINGSTSIFTLCRGCFSALCEKAVFFIKEVLILNKDTKLFPVRRQQTCMNFHFATYIMSGNKTKNDICPEHLPVVTT